MRCSTSSSCRIRRRRRGSGATCVLLSVTSSTRCRATGHRPPSLPVWVTESDIDVYVKQYARSGFHGPLAWWRNIDRGWELMAPFAGAAVTVPALYMAGERDFVAAVFSQDIAKQSTLVP